MQYTGFRFFTRYFMNQKKNGIPNCKAWIISFFILLCTQSVFAMTCKLEPGNQLFLDATISNNIPIAADAADGTLLWQSKDYSVPIKCVDDWGTGSTEKVYIYLNPAKAAIATGAEIGIVFNNITYVESAGKIFSGITMQKDQVSMSGILNFRVVLVKKGAAPTSGQLTINTYRVFQLDGEYGLNTTPNSNFNFRVSGGIRFVGCYADLTFSPGNVIDFGNIASSAPQGLIASRSLTLTGARKCATPYTTRISFTPANGGTLKDNMMDYGNGLAVSLIEAGGPAVTLGDENFNAFVNLNSVATASKSYTVSLRRTAAPAKLGPFSGQLIINLDYQ